MFRKYLSMITLLLFSLFILFAFITPIVVNGTSEIGDIVVISLILASFLAALFSQKGKLKIVALIVSLMPVLLLVGYLVLPIFYLLEQWAGLFFFCRIDLVDWLVTCVNQAALFYLNERTRDKVVYIFLSMTLFWKEIASIKTSY